METNEHLEHAPIKEAIIDLRLNSNIGIGQLDSLKDSLPEGYSELKPTFRQGVHLAFNDGVIETKEQRSQQGYRSDQTERGFVAQFHENGITVSKLPPYTEWSDFKREARTLWDIYKTILGKVELSRIAVRYINEIHLPLTDGKLDFDQYLTNCPKIPIGMPDILVNFLSRIAVPYDKLDALALVTLSLGDGNRDFFPLTLDIDVYRNQKLDLPEREIWALFDELRAIKNQAFSGSITETTKAIYR